jgi:hypothetical protein
MPTKSKHAASLQIVGCGVSRLDEAGLRGVEIGLKAKGK